MALREPDHDPVRHQFTVLEYEEMGRAGIFDPGSRFELIDGEIIEMNPIGWPHAGIVTTLNNLLAERYRQWALVSPQNPLHLSDVSMPQPDLVLVRRVERRSGHPTPDDVLLVIEVSDSTLGFDRRVKLPLYAKAGVVETLIVDVQAQRVEAYRVPGSDGYREVQIHGVGEAVGVVAVPGVQLSVAEIFE